MKFIVAVDSEWGIGYKNDLLARVKEDLINFKNITTGKVVILGAKTLSTFPGGKVLPKRTNIVLKHDVNYKPDGAVVCHSTEELFEELKNYDTNDVFVIGGATVYNELIPFCDTGYVTKFKKSYPKDTYIKNLDSMPEWEKIYESEEHISYDTDTDPGMRFTFTEYRKIK